MIVDHGVSRTIRRAIEHGDYVRRERSRLMDVEGSKEWMHFCITDPNFDIIVNFSTMDDSRPGAKTGDELHRLTCAVRLHGWDGDIETFHTTDVTAKAGRTEMRFGDNFVRYAGGVYHLRVALERRPIDLDVYLHPAALPSQVNNIPLADGSRLHWFVVPRLLAFGQVSLGEWTADLANVPAYHDHNWGSFAWGQDFRWTWGYGHGSDGWTVIFDRLSDRARHTDLRRGLVLWKGARQHRVWNGSEISVRTRGRFQPAEALRLPRVMSLLDTGAANDLPEFFECSGASLGDTFELSFESKTLCQFVAPNERDLGVTVINEVGGDLELSGSVGGERFAWRGHGMFEFLSG